MSSTVRVTGAAIQRDDPKILFQTGYFSSPHAAGQYHPYAVSTDGQRFLLPQVDNPVALLQGLGGRGSAATAAVFGAIAVDRHATTFQTPSGAGASLNVILNWTNVVKEN
jgi:hypothetical protein